ncbi:alanine racemase [Rubrivirga litoralis]|uniref:Alanine racemase n=1 Tax=Rubrivirga litoralis TaxID=3075598 RepID=A0ABU3BS53_9BACT|nr:alanine racemase [Rubrivirga sp. F394]MDT0632122.1 alanine racemase [Rubrivirga sp. F394]
MLVSDLPTPALLVDRARLHANLDAAQARADALGVALRPHAKTHKSPDLARLQAERGARGLTVATTDEAEAFAAAGFDDIRVATPVVSAGKLARLARLQGEGVRVSFTVDSAAGVARASRAFSEAGQTAEVLIEVDSGHGRCGVEWDDRPALAQLGAVAGGAEAVQLVGVLTHGGMSYDGPRAGETADDALQHAADAERDRVLAAAEALVEAGWLDAATAEVSIGSTPAFGRFRPAEGGGRGGLRVTEARPGTYVFYDAGQVALGAARLQDCALLCVGTTLSVRRDDDGTERTITDAGKKVLTSDGGAGLAGFGTVLYSPRTMIAHPHARVTTLSEEHGFVDTPGGAIWEVGDPVFVVPNHACVAVATRRELFVVDGDEVVESWETVAR